MWLTFGGGDPVEFIRKYKAGQRSREARGRQTRLDRLERLERPQEHNGLNLKLPVAVRSGREVVHTSAMRVGYIGPDGRWTAGPTFAGGGDFHGGLARVNVGGRWVASDWEDRREGHGRVFQWYGFGLVGGKWGFIDRAGELTIPVQFDDARDFSVGFAPVRKGSAWGYIDRTGTVVWRSD